LKATIKAAAMFLGLKKQVLNQAEAIFMLSLLTARKSA
jgi:hypothetical protein